ncbi:MAG TPA: SpoIIE family protein phosphatase [Terriglobales bacterium]|jgi:sigma-B regulation protein RsbU (phosphoserine phosphatase)|nr:SpoIIE family protein phosphatase [Terriglobales bacterium]
MPAAGNGAPVQDKLAPSAAIVGNAAAISMRLENFLIEVADTLNSTLEMDKLLGRVAELVRQVIDYEIFAILLLNERTQELRIRFQIGHTPETERLKIKVGQGVTGMAVERRSSVLVDDVRKEPRYINADPIVRSELAVPLIAKKRVIGVIDIQASKEGYFTDEHNRILTIVASRIAAAIENARLYTRVARQAQTLTVLNEISRELTSILNVDQLFKRIGELLTRVIEYQMFSILLVDAERAVLVHRFSLRYQENIHLKHDIPLGRGLVGYAVQEKTAVLAPDVSKDPRYIQLNPETRSELCVPLLYKGTAIGVLDLESTRRNYYNEDHVRTLTTLAGQIAIAIENARLYERIAREEQRLERDLSMAREIQIRLLPQSLPRLKSADIAAKFEPALMIGGDMFDFLEYSGDRVALVLGDVSGKGAPAALYAALVSGLLRSTASLEPHPAQMLSAINLSLNERRIEAQYVSLAYAVWDDDSRTMTFANSGLPRPFLCKNGIISRIESTGLPLGLFEEADYDEVTVHAESGDVFVLVSDGILDAISASGEQFGPKRVEEIVQKNCSMQPNELVQLIFDAVDTHRGTRATFDDETVLAVKVR